MTKENELDYESINKNGGHCNMKDDDFELDYEREGSIGFFRNIAILIGFMLLGFAIFAMCGCATFDKLGGDRANKHG